MSDLFYFSDRESVASVSLPLHTQDKIAHRAYQGGRSGAFTLVELLTVIAIIGILAAILIPTVGGMLGRAKLATCVANLRAVGAGMLLYTVENNGCLPGHGASSNGETGAGQRWHHKTAVYMGLGLPVKVVQASGGGTSVQVCEDAGSVAVFHCSSVEPEYYMGTNPRNGALGLYRSNLNVITRSTHGLSLDQIPYPSQTVVLVDGYAGSDLSDKSKIVSGPNMAVNAPPYPINSSGPSANHRPDGNPSADPQGAGLCPMLFADGHAEAVELSELQPWTEVINSSKRPKKITMVSTQ